MFLRLIIRKLYAFLPFTYPDIIARQLKGMKSILDVGCGEGELTATIRLRIPAFCVGIELDPPSLTEAKRNRTHDEYVLADARFLPFRPESFDAVLCSQVIEHLEKESGLKVIRETEKVGISVVIISTTVGYIPFLPLNSVTRQQIHRSAYYPQEFASRNYKVTFQGMKLFYGEKGLMRKVPRLMRLLLSIFSYLMAPIVGHFSSLALYQIATLRLER